MNVDEKLCENIFIPGGPCISGIYWDMYLKNSEIEGKRLTLFNHEDKYDSSTKSTFTEVVEDLIKFLIQHKSTRKFNLIAHSFGAWVALGAFADPRIKQMVERLILVSLPLTSTQDKRTIAQFEELTSITAESNESFRLYWKAIFPMYVSHPLSKDLQKKITNEVFWEGNENISLEGKELKKLISFTKDERIKVIFGEHDMITPPSDSRNNYIISGAGHFPMLECSEKFTQVLKRCLTSSQS